MNKFHVENLGILHLDDVMQIEAACYGKHHWSRNSFVSELSNNCARYLAAVDENNKCIGYMGTWRIFDEAHVTNLAVHPDFQGRGIAHLLILSMLKGCYLDKIKYLTLEVRKSNERAMKVYEHFGFKSLGVRKKYYQDNGEDAVIMWTESIFTDKYKNIYEENKKILSERSGV